MTIPECRVTVSEDLSSDHGCYCEAATRSYDEFGEWGSANRSIDSTNNSSNNALPVSSNLRKVSRRTYVHLLTKYRRTYLRAKAIRDHYIRAKCALTDLLLVLQLYVITHGLELDILQR
ncbi:uncharacterized protein [Diadema setosum]|uniref:uncharacterized protein n=1 Tax=Diadema setosum TaxID=31175 RepID=UPI003B3B8EC4